MTENRNPEQIARDHIDEQLKLAGWRAYTLNINILVNEWWAPTISQIK